MSFILEQFHLALKCVTFAQSWLYHFWRYKIHYLNYFHEFYIQMFKFELCDDVPCATGEMGDRISTVVVVSSIQHKIQNRK